MIKDFIVRKDLRGKKCVFFFKLRNSQPPLGYVYMRMKSECDKSFHYTYDNITSDFSSPLFMETKDGGGKLNRMKCQSNLIWPSMYCHSLCQCRNVNIYVLLKYAGLWEPRPSHMDLPLSGISSVLSTSSVLVHTHTHTQRIIRVYLLIFVSLQLDHKCREDRNLISFALHCTPSS